MPLATGEGLSKSYGAQDVLRDISFQIGHGDKIALVGTNGAGKSTLLGIIAGHDQPSSGQVHRKRGLRIGFLPQRAELDGQRTLLEEMEQAFAHLHRMEAELRDLERRMAQDGAPLARYSALLARFEQAGGYAYQAHIREVLGGLGFDEQDLQRPLTQLSGGERTRAFLARLLLESPELLLLDEPTNHLDVQAIEWLEDWLGHWSGSLVVVAHDRYFLDRVVGRVWDLAFGRLEAYPGNYSAYASLREARIERRRKEYESQQEVIARTEDFIRRFQAGQRSREARGRAKRLARLERLGQPREQKVIHLALSASTRSGDLVLASEGLTIGYPDRPLFTCPDLYLKRGQCAALLGPNGSGKTSFIRTLLEEMRPLSGRLWLGHNVTIGYLPQQQEGLLGARTVVEEILSVRDLPLEQVRGFLGRFLFTGDDVFKRISDLSGGERSRVILAKLTLKGANFLVLDEPTNHLDIASCQIVADVLAGFEGTILFVSHDRSLVDQLASQVWVIDAGDLRVYRGNYSDIVLARQRERAVPEPALVQPVAPKSHLIVSSDRDTRTRLRRTSALEEEIIGLESRLEELEQGLESASRARQVGDLHVLGREYEAAQRRLEELVDEWGQISA